MTQPQFVHHADLDILEESGVYKAAHLYRQKDCTSVIVLSFCESDECEGLDGKYSMAKDGKIYDPDGDEILYRNLVKVNVDDAPAAISACEMISANVNFGEKKLPSAFFRRNAIVR